MSFDIFSKEFFFFKYNLGQRDACPPLLRVDQCARDRDLISHRLQRQTRIINKSASSANFHRVYILCMLFTTELILQTLFFITRIFLKEENSFLKKGVSYQEDSCSAT